MNAPPAAGTRAPWPEIGPAGRYRLDPAASSITFRTRHLFGLASVSGSLRVISGEVVLDAARRVASLTVSADPASIATGNRRRDTDIRSPRFLDVAAHPVLEYRASKIDQEHDGWTMTGELTVRTTTRPLTFNVTAIEPTDDGFRARAHASVDRYAFALTAAKGMAARHLEVEVAAVAQRF